MPLTILENPEIRQLALPVSVPQYHKLGELGIIAEKTELIEGVVIVKMPKSPRHRFLVQRLQQLLSALLPGYIVQKEDPITLADSEPEPDISVVSGKPEDYRLEHPHTAALVVEVSVTSIELDRAKIGMYARAGIAEYWIVNDAEHCVEVYTQPNDDGYAHCRKCNSGEAIESLAVQTRLTVNELLD